MTESWLDLLRPPRPDMATRVPDVHLRDGVTNYRSNVNVVDSRTIDGAAAVTAVIRVSQVDPAAPQATIDKTKMFLYSHFTSAFECSPLLRTAVDAFDTENLQVPGTKHLV